MRSLRMKKKREWERWKILHKQLRRLGYKGDFGKISISRWRNADCHLIHKAFLNEWFAKQGLYDMVRKKQF